jgi:hypothetical protein
MPDPEPYDFEHPDEVAKREQCKREGHVTKNHLGAGDFTHGTKDCCVRCGRFWHNEPVPPEMTPEEIAACRKS